MKKGNYEAAYVDDPEQIIMAAQRSIITMIEGIVSDLKSSVKQPGLTWEQIEYLLAQAKIKKPEILTSQQLDGMSKQ